MQGSVSKSSLGGCKFIGHSILSGVKSDFFLLCTLGQFQVKEHSAFALSLLDICVLHCFKVLNSSRLECICK